MKVKEIIPQKREGVIESGKVIIEENGKEYTVSAKMMDILDDDTFPNLCSVWKRDIKKKEEFAKMNEKAITDKVKKFKGKTIKV
jgi:hypothetical protein